MLKYIFHISDIHIIEKNYLNIKNSFKILNDEIKLKGVEISLLVIAGDIFESKSFLNTDDIFQWKMMCKLLEKNNIKTLVMCGNHDYNINSELVRDNVSLLTSGYKNIVCVNTTAILDGIIFNDPSLEFYIFSPIDKKIPRILDNNLTKIALLHEPINCAVYDNGELISNARFTANDLKEYDYVLLGDIHLTQFLTDRIAYCGSFVQKTKGEGIDKGYILWDLETRSGVFHKILLKEIYIKIIATNDNAIIPSITKEQRVRHTSLIYKDCSVTYIESLKKLLNEKYGYINRIVNNTKQIIPNNNNEIIEQGNKGYNHDNIIKNILKDNENLAKVLEYHNKILKNRSENNFTTYKLNYLYWSNVFCYGENNYINFTEFHNNLVMLNGKNKEGKSSIIDIIIRVLFNECERGFKEDIVNKSKSKGFIKISFNINKDEYVIEQVFHRVSKNQQHRLYKNNVNITKDTIINTYIFLRKEVGLGDYKDFVNMTTALQNRKFLVDMPQKDFISLLTKITNIDILKDVEDENKKKISVLKAVNKKNLSEFSKIPDINLIDIENLNLKIINLKKVEIEILNDIDLINKNLIKLNKNYNNLIIPNDLNEQILTCINSLESYTDDRILKYKIDDITLVNNKLYALEKKLESIREEELQNIINLDYSRLNNLDKNDIINQATYLNTITYKPSKDTFRTLEVLQNIINNPVLLNIEPIEYSNIKEPFILDILDKDTELLKTNLPNYIEIETNIVKYLNKIKHFNTNFGSMIFSQDCKNCIINKSYTNLYNNNLDISQLDDLKKLLLGRPTLELKYNKALNYANKLNQNEIFERNLIVNNNNKKIIEKNKVFTDANIELKQLINFNNYETLNNLNQDLDLFKKHNIKKSILLKNQYTNDKTYIEILIKYKNLVDILEIKKSNGNQMIEIQKLTELELINKKKYTINNINLINLLETYRVKKTQFDNKENLLKAHKENITELDFLETYNKIVNCKTGIPSHVLKNTCIMVQNNCNKILQTIADFVIYIEYDKDIKIYTIENDIKIPATMGSGMQKFVLDLIFRITLTEISSVSSPKTLFVDEGFGSLDKENFIAIANILQKLKNNFDSLIVISHISELRSYMDISINIIRKDYLSYVKHGTLTSEQKNLKLMIETNRENKNVDNFKESVKQNKTITKQKDADDKLRLILYYCENNNGLENILLVNQDNNIFCKGCNKEYVLKKNFIEKHLTSATNIVKHNKYILTLLNL